METEAIVGIAELVRLTLGHFDEPRSVALEVRFQAGYWLDRLYERRQESSEQGQKNRRIKSVEEAIRSASSLAILLTGARVGLLAEI